jgi:hypothetical protein
MAYQIKDTEDLQSQLSAAGDKLVVLRVWRGPFSAHFYGSFKASLL